jgi:hypothetical protein
MPFLSLLLDVSLDGGSRDTKKLDNLSPGVTSIDGSKDLFAHILWVGFHSLLLLSPRGFDYEGYPGQLWKITSSQICEQGAPPPKIPPESHVARTVRMLAASW